MNILFLGGAKRVSIGRMILDAANSLEPGSLLYSYELDRYQPIASIATVIEGLKWNDPNVIADLAAIVKKCDIKLVVPFVDKAVEVAATLRDHLDGAVFAPTGSASMAATMFNKRLADVFFRSYGLPVPSRANLAKPTFPIIFKPIHGSASKGIIIARKRQDIPFDNSGYIAQEYIEHREEYTVDCYIASDSRVICAVPRRRIETAGGEVTRSITVDIPELTTLIHQVLTETQLTGAVTLQFIHDLDTNRFLLMEINPRLGGGAVTAVHAGANIPMFMVREALHLPIEPCFYLPDVEIARYPQEVAFHRLPNHPSL